MILLADPHPLIVQETVHRIGCSSADKVADSSVTLRIAGTNRGRVTDRFSGEIPGKIAVNLASLWAAVLNQDFGPGNRFPRK
jgi:hypothetical protein